MAWCLTRDQEDRFRNALVEGKIDPFKLADMTSNERKALFEKYVDKENAVNINSLFESKLLLKNQQQGFETWAKRSIGMAPKVKRDLLSKIERLDEVGVLEPSDLKSFKEDLVRTRLGFGVTFEEAKTINKLSEARVEAKEKWEKEINKHPEWKKDPHKTRGEWKNNDVRIDYGLKQVALENYVNDLKLVARREKVTFQEDPIRAVLNPIREAPQFFNNLFKSLGASIDNSLFGRQGIKNLYGSPAQKRIWVRNFVKSFGDISAELKNSKVANGFDTMNLIKADIYSRPNALNGKYKAGDYGLNVLHEEIFPTSLPEKVPGLGRLFKASETAFSGGSLRMRADLADLLISKMESQGLNALNPEQAKAVGNLVGSMTGRGKISRDAKTIRQLNFLLWSARFFKANVDTLTAHQFDNKATKFTKTEARKNLVSIVAHIAGIMLLAKFLDPDSVDEDPRSTNFGRIKIFGHWTDITGGMRSIVVMAGQLIPHKRNGEWGVWKKSSTGNWTNLISGKFGAMDGVDVFMNAIFLNKLAPVASIIRDFYRGEMFGGDPFNIKKSIVNSATPFSIQTVFDVKDESFATILAVAISEFFGLGVSTYKYQDNWERKTSKEMKNFREQVGDQKFKDANDAYNRAYNIWFEEVQKDEKYKKLSDEGKRKLKSDARKAIKKKILDEYGYDPTEKPESLEKLKEKEVIKELKPMSSLINKAIDVITKIDIVSDVIASEGKEGMTVKQRTRFDEIKQRITDLASLIANRKKSKLISPQRIDVLTDEVKRLTKESQDLLNAPMPPEEIDEKPSTSLGRDPRFKTIKPKDNVKNAIEKAAAEFGIPSGLLFDIALQESSLNPSSVNKKRPDINPTGLFQFTDETWKKVLKFNKRKGSSLYGKLPTTDRTDPETNAMAAAFLIKFGQLGRWDASEDVWGEFWTVKELEDMGFYKQSKHHKKGVRPSVRLGKKK